MFEQLPFPGESYHHVLSIGYEEYDFERKPGGIQKAGDENMKFPHTRSYISKITAVFTYTYQVLGSYITMLFTHKLPVLFFPPTFSPKVKSYRSVFT